VALITPTRSGEKIVSGIRTVIVTTPAMLRDLIQQLAHKRVELDIVAEFAARHALARRLAKIRPDLVVIGLRDHEDETLIRNLLALIPTAKFIAFSAKGRGARGFELRLYQTDFNNVPPEGLVDFILSCSTPLQTQTHPPV
jgi:chemotaxis response regulator CheB